MVLDCDLRKLVADLGRARSVHQETNTRIQDLKDQMREKDERLTTALETADRMRKESANKKSIKKLLDEIRMIPEYKKKLGDLSRTVDLHQTTLDDKNEESNKLKEKHLQDMSDLQERIEEERKLDHEEERRKIQDIEQFFKQAHEVVLRSMETQAEREMQAQEKEVRVLQEKMAQMEAEHLAEIQTMKVQLAAANNAAYKPTPIDTDIYTKKMSEMRQHYDKQLVMMAEELASCKRLADEDPEDRFPEKEEVYLDQSMVSTFPPAPGPVEEANTTLKAPKLVVPPASQYQSLFQEATVKFSNPSARFKKPSIHQPLHQPCATFGGPSAARPTTTMSKRGSGNSFKFVSRPTSSPRNRTDLLSPAPGDVILSPAPGNVILSPAPGVGKKSAGRPSPYPAVVELGSRGGREQVRLRGGEEEEQAGGARGILKRQLYSEAAGPQLFE